MKVYGAGMILCLLVTTAVAGCTGESELAEGPAESPSVEQPAVEPAPGIEFPRVPSVPDDAVGQISVSGRLMEVDPGEMTFRIEADDGAEQTFRYTESTEVTGVAEGQGLAAQAGSPVDVFYDDDDFSPPVALRIEVGAAGPAFN